VYKGNGVSVTNGGCKRRLGCRKIPGPKQCGIRKNDLGGQEFEDQVKFT
jgi:hypothetical protein